MTCANNIAHRVMATLSILLPLAIGASGCPSTTSARRGPPRAEPTFSRTDAHVVVRDDEGAPLADLNASVLSPRNQSRRVTVVMVPGAGRASRDGERKGNGTRDYDGEIPFTALFAESFADAGLRVLAYDKRTCAPTDSPSCRANSTADLDALGPVALARDIDAACRLAAEGGDEIVLFAHGQAAQIALASTCAKTAAALVLVGPIPDAVDRVIVRGLSRRATLLRKWGDKERQSPVPETAAAGEQKIVESLALQNRAADFRDVFALLRAGKFEAGASVLGAPPAFWLGWIALTESTPALLKENPAPRVVAMGQWDSQYAPADKSRIEKMASAPELFVVVEKGDHYLMIDRTFERDAHIPVVDAVLQALAARDRPAS